jgi:hypothetical protein
MPPGKFKILIAGPKQCGKSTLMNAVGDPSASNDALINQIYIPTVGTRILELSRDKRLVEVWEVPSDSPHLWPVFKEGAAECIFVYASGQRKELDQMMTYFKTKHPLVISSDDDKQPFPTTSIVGPFKVPSTAITDFRDIFEKWLSNYVLA